MTFSSFENIDTARSYVSEEKLKLAIEKRMGTNVRYMVVRNRAGRYTAIFSAEMNREVIMPIHIANFGFKVFN